MLPRTADVVIIGGGVLGASAAFHLAAQGVGRIVLVDRGPVAGGTTPFAAGQTSYVNRDPFALQFGIYCIEFFEQFRERTGYAIDFRQPGSLRVALTETYRADLEARRAAARDAGHAVEFLSPGQVAERVPLLALPDDCSILFVPRDGWVEPRSVAAAYAAAARDRGVTIRTRLAATGLETAGERVCAVQTAEGRIETPWVVLAAGAWTRRFGQQLGLNLRVVPVRHQAFVTAPLAGVRMDQPIVRITEPQIYARPEAGGLLVGGYGYRPLSFDLRDLPERFEIPSLEADPVYYAQLKQAARPFFPTLDGAVIIQERRGLPTIAPDGRLMVGESEQAQGLVVTASCMVGGIQHSPGVGRLVAEIVTGQPTWLPASEVSVDRFGEDYAADAALRGRCEEIYSHHYHEVY
jgi:4-methylaminobutanoate oxidase (formaldehyde-forming)